MADNGLRFQIRHGSGNPNNNLKQYELGYDYTNKKFYIGADTSSEEIKYLHLTGGTLSGKLRIETKTGDAKAYCQVKDADTDAYIQMGIQRDKEKIGICTNGYYDTSKNFISTSTNWMIYRDTNGKNIFKGNADSATKDGAGNTISTYYLPLIGGTLTGDLIISPTTITNPAYVSIRRKVDTTYYKGRLYVSSAGFTILDNSISTNNSDWTQKGYLAVGEKDGEVYGSVNGYKILTTANYDEYALPLTGGTLKGDLDLYPSTLTNQITLRIKRKVGDTYYLYNQFITETNRVGLYLYKSTNNSTWSQVSYLTFGPYEGSDIDVAFLSGQRLVTSSNYSNYALPLSGGTLTGSLKFSSGAKSIFHTYNSTDYEILKSANTGNVSLNAKGAYLYLGYYTTSRIYIGAVGEGETAPPLYIGPGIYNGTSVAKLYFKTS